MGIEGFSNFLKSKAPKSIVEIPLKALSGKKICIDMANLIFRMRCGAISQAIRSTDLLSEEPSINLINKINTKYILDRLALFLYHNINVICIFDSEPHPLRSIVHGRRKKDKDDVKAKFDEIRKKWLDVSIMERQVLIPDYIKYYTRFYTSPPFGYMAHIQNLCRELGFPTYNPSIFFPSVDGHPSSGDGEALCATFCMNGNDYCWGAYTNDSDFHVYGGNYSILDIFEKNITGIREYHIQIRCLESILSQLNVDFDSFQKICIIGGCDYNERIVKVQSTTVYNKFIKAGSFEKLKSMLDITPSNIDEVSKIFRSSIIKIEPPQLIFDIIKFNTCSQKLLNNESYYDYIKVINDIPMFKLDRGLPSSLPSNLPNNLSVIFDKFSVCNSSENLSEEISENTYNVQSM